MSRVLAAQTKQYTIKYKCVIKVIRNVKQAIKFDNDNGNTLWQYAIGK